MASHLLGGIRKSRDVTRGSNESDLKTQPRWGAYCLVPVLREELAEVCVVCDPLIRLVQREMMFPTYSALSYSKPPHGVTSGSVGRVLCYIILKLGVQL